MPNGKIHHELWMNYRVPAVTASIALVVPAYYATGSMETALTISLSSIAGYLIGIFLTPDLDLISITDSEALAIKSVVFLPLIAWSTLYARIMQVFGGHRSMWSHLPVFSTFIRLCWFSFPLVALMYFLGWLGHGQNYIPYFVGLLFGLSMSDTVHSVADFSFSLRRKFINKTRSRRIL